MHATSLPTVVIVRVTHERQNRQLSFQLTVLLMPKNRERESMLLIQWLRYQTTYIQTINISSENEDHPISTADPSSSFSTKPAWNALSTHRITALTHTKICHSKMAFKISFHVLRLLKDKLATDVDLTSVDGYCKGNPTSVGEGGILRDQNGHMIMAFTSYLGECSNNYTEIQAIKIELKWCLDNGFRNLILCYYSYDQWQHIYLVDFKRRDQEYSSHESRGSYSI
ncbi:hypothetical protein MTR67_040495 [Solanum verrucosum]|uniref:RNase H type-1 domain-containing protein n=1 Tax=Solanum verrucosum TaxID=315347 RepID=A0AAF0UIN0_SOLVR|nr:hypothetical protein MTR67_040495 [Solanum verrucosum]